MSVIHMHPFNGLVEKIDRLELLQGKVICPVSKRTI